MLKSKLLFTAFITTILSFGGTAQAEDILSIFERNAQRPKVEAPKTIPYIYTVEIDVFGKDGAADAKDKSISDTDTDTDTDTEDTSDKDDAPKAQNYSAVLEINPTLSGEDRVSIISFTGDNEDEDYKSMLAEFTDENITEADLAKDFWCDNTGAGDEDDEGFLKDNVTVISETENEAIIKPDLSKMATILFDSNSDDTVSGSEKKLMRRMVKRLDAELVFNKPDGQLKQMKIWMTRPMRVALIAKIKEMNLLAKCETAPNGRLYKSQQDLTMKMSALGAKVEQNVHRRVTNLRPLP